MTAVYAALVSVATALALGLAAAVEGWALAVACALGVVAIAVGWPDLLGLPEPRGSALLTVGAGVIAVLVAREQVEVAAGRPAALLPSSWVSPDRPVAAFPALIALAVLVAFGLELLRRDGRADLVESVTGTLTGQMIAVTMAGWMLLAGTGAGRNAVIVTAVSVVVARAVPLLPPPIAPDFTAWAAVGAAGVAAGVASLFARGVPPLTAFALGAAVGGVGVALDRLLGAGVGAAGQRGPTRLPALVARSVAPIAVGGTVAYALVQMTTGG